MWVKQKRCDKMMKKIIPILLVILLLFAVASNIISTSALPNLKKSSSDNKGYAVIIVGRYFPYLDFNLSNWGPDGNWKNLETIQQYYTWYLNAASEIYNTLIDNYGYTDDSIFLLVKQLPSYIKVPLNETDEDKKTVWKNFFEKPSNFNPDWIDKEYTPDESGLKKVLSTFKPGGKNALDNDDSLFVCFIDHGGTDKNDQTYFGCPLYDTVDVLQYFTFLFNHIDSNSNLINSVQNLIELLGFQMEPQKVYDYEFSSYVENIKAKMIFALQPCHSGGFIKELAGKNRIICTASRVKQFADAWIEPFTRALNGAAGADYNCDNKISIQEAYRYAAEYVEAHFDSKHPQHPLIDDNGDGLGSHLRESSYDPTNPEKDGYIAAQTYLDGSNGRSNTKSILTARPLFNSILTKFLGNFPLLKQLIQRLSTFQ